MPPEPLATLKDARKHWAALLRAIADADVVDQVNACLDIDIHGFGIELDEAIARLEKP